MEDRSLELLSTVPLSQFFEFEIEQPLEQLLLAHDIGQRVDVKDTFGTWTSAQVVDKHQAKGLLVHYLR